MSNINLEEAHCEACQGNMPIISGTEVSEWISAIDLEWNVSDAGTTIERKVNFKNFSQTMFFVNALAHIAYREGHHPDVNFGYNYCHVRFTTHEAGGLTRNDFICAKKVDALLNN